MMKVALPGARRGAMGAHRTPAGGSVCGDEKGSVARRWGRRLPFVSLAALLGATLLLAAAGAAGQTGPTFHVTRYGLTAELFPTTHLITAKARVDFMADASISSLNFQLNSALHVDRVTDAKGQDASFHQDGLNLTINLSSPLAGNQSSFVTVLYGGSLETATGSPVEALKLAYVGPEGSYLLYEGDWFPVRPPGLDRFAATLHITVPSDETVIASGKAASPVREAGKVTYTYTYDRDSFPGTVFAGQYAIVPASAVGADITFYLKRGQESYAASYGDAAERILEFFSSKFGSLPSGHLAVVEIADDTVGGVSAPGVIALASRAFSKPVNDQLLAHEIARQWWNGLLSPATPNDAFLDEGLATYSAAMYVQSSAGEEAFEGLMHHIAVGALTHEEVAPVNEAGQLHPFTPEYQSIVFQKGAMVFHMLRWVMGDEAFFKTLQAMAQQDAWKTVTTDDFQHLAEKASGQQLTYFFAQWVSSTGVPQFKRTWAIYRLTQGYQIVGKIQQDLDIFRMPVDVRVYTEGRSPVDSRIEMVGTTADFTINTSTKPLRVVVDPASRILKIDSSLKVEVLMADGDQLVQEQAYFDAIKQYQKVLDLNKNNSLAHYRLGEIYFKLRNYNAAVEEMRDALNGDLEPKWVEVWAHLTLGKIFDVTGQRDRALNEYQRALQTNDNTQGALTEANRYIQKPYTAKEQQSG